MKRARSLVEDLAEDTKRLRLSRSNSPDLGEAVRKDASVAGISTDGVRDAMGELNANPEALYRAQAQQLKQLTLERLARQAADISMADNRPT